MKKEQFNFLLANQSKHLTPQALRFTRDEDDAKDLIQDTILKALHNSDKFREGTNFRGWLYTIMHNLFVNNYRKKKLKTCPLEADMVSQLKVENQAESNIRVKTIRASLERLPEQYYQPINMYIDGYKYQEITDELSLPIGTIKNRIHIARKLLKQSIA